MPKTRCLLNQMKYFFTNSQKTILNGEKKFLLSPIKFKQTINYSKLFSTSSRSNAIPPLLWLIFKPVTKLGAILVGRGFRVWWTSLPEVKRGIFMAHLKRNQIRYGIFISSSTLGSVGYYEWHVQETPITHRRRFILFSSSHLAEIENLEKDQVKKFFIFGINCVFFFVFLIFEIEFFRYL